MLKRLFDILFAALILLALSPIFFLIATLIFFTDFDSPLYLSLRIGKGGKPFKMIKFRSMRTHINSNKLDTTTSDDIRITTIGKYLRKYKLDELPQFFNVLIGNMSIIGPRPNVERETRLYTDIEKTLLSVKPGISDLASIIFSDLGKLLQGHNDPNIAYNQLIRPWKSRLGLLYIEHQSISLDIKIIWMTILECILPKLGRFFACKIIQKMHADEDLQKIAERKIELYPCSPPGSDTIVISRF